MKSDTNIEMELYIVRHGESLGNVGYNGKKELTLREANDAALTERGVAQAQAAGEYLKAVELDAIYTSPLLRAACTAAEIAKKQPKKKPFYVYPELCEIGIDEQYEGVELGELRGIYPEAEYAQGGGAWLFHESHSSHEEIYARAKSVSDFIHSRYKNGEKVLLVSHAAFMTNLVLYIMNIKGNEASFDLDFSNTGITKVTFYKYGTNKWGDVVFNRINDTSHYLLMK